MTPTLSVTLQKLYVKDCKKNGQKRPKNGQETADGTAPSVPPENWFADLSPTWGGVLRILIDLGKKFPRLVGRG